MNVCLSKLSLAVGKDELATLKLFKSSTDSLKRSQRSNLKRPGEVCTPLAAMESQRCMHVSRCIKLPARHVQAHKYLHTLECCFCTLCSLSLFFFFYFSRVNFYLNAKQVIGAPVSSRSSSLVWALFLIRVLLCLT